MQVDLLAVSCEVCGGLGWDDETELPCQYCGGTGVEKVERRGRHDQDME
jgi:DnaJ-class molecular chaperone